MLYHAQGDALITRQEFLERSRQELPRFYDELLAGGTPKSLGFSTGALTARNAMRGYVVEAKADIVPWEPIGPGKPLTVQIWEIYTGKHPPHDIWLGRPKDMLVTSAVKSIATYDAKPPALNYLVKGVPARSTLKRPKATEEGTPFAFYSPALLDNSLTLDLSIVFDRFKPEIFDSYQQGIHRRGGHTHLHATQRVPSGRRGSRSPGRSRRRSVVRWAAELQHFRAAGHLLARQSSPSCRLSLADSRRRRFCGSALPQDLSCE